MPTTATVQYKYKYGYMVPLDTRTVPRIHTREDSPPLKTAVAGAGAGQGKKAIGSPLLLEYYRRGVWAGTS